MKEFATLAEFAAYTLERAQAVEAAASTHDDPTCCTEAEWNKTFLNPSPNENECRYCRAMATCPAWAAKVEDTFGMSLEAAAGCFASETGMPVPETPERFSAAMKVAWGIRESWTSAVLAEGERRLLAGQPVEGFGLELGHQGSRAWTDETAAENLLRKTFRLKVEDTFDFKLKSPTQVEKLGPKRNSKGEIVAPKPGVPEPAISARQWEKVQALIGRAPAKPSVKPTHEIKTLYVPEVPSADAFEAVADDNEDLA